MSGNTITYSSRGILGTKARQHGAGETIRQFIATPTGPNGGPYTTMTVDLTPRRVQNFLLADGSTVTCTIRPFGETSTIEELTVTDGLWTPTGVKINATGPTNVECISGAAIASIPFDDNADTNIAAPASSGGVLSDKIAVDMVEVDYDFDNGN